MIIYNNYNECQKNDSEGSLKTIMSELVLPKKYYYSLKKKKKNDLVLFAPTLTTTKKHLTIVKLKNAINYF